MKTLEYQVKTVNEASEKCAKAILDMLIKNPTYFDKLRLFEGKDLRIVALSEEIRNILFNQYNIRKRQIGLNEK